MTDDTQTNSLARDLDEVLADIEGGNKALTEAVDLLASSKNDLGTMLADRMLEKDLKQAEKEATADIADLTRNFQEHISS